MDTRKCAVCARSLEGRKPQARFCSDSCRSAGRKTPHNPPRIRIVPPPVDPPLAPVGDLGKAVDAAISRMHWLNDTDQGAAQLARVYARSIDAGETAFDLAKVGPQLLNALKSLGGTPAERAALSVERDVKGRLADLRAQRDRSTG